jgi:hypothetical protein
MPDMIIPGTKPTEPLARVTHAWNGKRIVEIEAIGDPESPLIQIRVNGFSIALDEAQWSRVRFHADDWFAAAKTGALTPTPS